MMNKKLFQKIIFIALILLILLSLVAPAIFSQTAAAPAQEKLLNGLKLLMWPDKTADKVSIKVRVHSGSAFDPQGKEGVMQLLADSIFPNPNARDFFVEDLGGSLEIVSNYDYTEISATAKPEHFLTMLETLATAISNPSIDKEQTARQRSELLTKITSWEADPSYVADQFVARRLLGTFPYGRPEDGSSASVAKVDFADLVEAKQRFLTADNATIAMSGNFDRNLALRASRRFFGSWLKADRKIPSTFREADVPPTGVLSVASPSAGSEIRMAMRGSARSDSDLAASMIFARILESRLKSRVPSQVAEKLFVRNNAQTLRGTIVFGFDAGKTDGGGKVVANDFVFKALSDVITETEFQAAKNELYSSWMKRDNASFWLDADTYKLPNLDAYKKMFDNASVADVNNFAMKVRKEPIVTVLLSNSPAKEAAK